MPPQDGSGGALKDVSTQRGSRACTMPQSAQKKTKRPKPRPGIDFDLINSAALRALPAILGRWLPHGRRQGPEYVALNPTRNDHRLGSFRINLRTGRWADFATGDKGGDPISLAAYLAHLTQLQAAQKLADMLSVEMRYGR